MMDKPDVWLCKYADSHNSHVKQATRTWTTLAVVSIYCLAVGISNEPDATLPLVKATLPKDQFAVIAMGLLAALVTHWQEVLNRAHNLRQGLVQARIDMLKQSGTPDAKEEWDAMVTASTQAVWGITSAFARSPKRVLRWIALPYFILLKLLSFAVHVGLPSVALVALLYLYPENRRFDAIGLLLGIFTLTITFQLLAATVTELRYSWPTIKEMWKLIKAR